MTFSRMPPEANEHLLHYMMHKKCGLLWEMCNAAGIDPFELEGLAECKKQLFQQLHRGMEVYLPPAARHRNEKLRFRPRRHAGRQAPLRAHRRELIAL